MRSTGDIVNIVRIHRAFRCNRRWLWISGPEHKGELAREVLEPFRLLPPPRAATRSDCPVANR